MSVDRIHQLRPFPNFKLHELPEDEWDEAGSIRANIGSMHDRATSFWAGRSLFQNCAERQLFDPVNGGVYRQWQLCAARDCAMSIYHFGRIIEGIDESLAHCPTLRDMIDVKAKRVAGKNFKLRFPSYISLRNALAHSAARAKTAKDFKRHGKKTSRTIKLTPELSIKLGADGSLLLDDNVYGTTFSSMWNGEIIKCEVNDQSGRWLDETINAYWAAFNSMIDPNPEPPPMITVS